MVLLLAMAIEFIELSVTCRLVSLSSVVVFEELIGLFSVFFSADFLVVLVVKLVIFLFLLLQKLQWDMFHFCSGFIGIM